MSSETRQPNPGAIRIHPDNIGIPSFEMGSPGIVQMELFGKWVDSGEADGLYFRKYQEPFVIRLFDKLERDANRRDGELNFIDFGEKLTTPELTPEIVEKQMEQLHRRKIYPRGMLSLDWVSEAPPGTPPFPETCSKPRNPAPSLEELELGYEY